MEIQLELKTDYDTHGWVGPIEVMSREEVARYKRLLIKADRQHDLMNSDYRCKSNVLFHWVDEISRHPQIVELVSSLIGPNFHCWDTLFWIKKAGQHKDVSYHQDSTYWNFDQPEKALTVWFPFDDVTLDHGPIEYVNNPQQPLIHEDIKTDTNLLMRGQTVAQLDKTTTTKVPCPAGSVLVHGPYTIHGSAENTTTTDRYAMGMIFVSTECKPILGLSDESTVMVNGDDIYNHMLHDPQPTGEWDVDLVHWKAAYDRQHINYYKMKQRAEHV
jgi:ectoine hydroxylase-related dioxygenase (phytanoyl-CoA dioxygenase family)